MTLVAPATGDVTAYLQPGVAEAQTAGKIALIEIHTCSVTKDQLASARTKPRVVTIRQTPAVARHPNPSAALAGLAEAGRDLGVSVEWDEQRASRCNRRYCRSVPRMRESACGGPFRLMRR